MLLVLSCQEQMCDQQNNCEHEWVKWFLSSIFLCFFSIPFTRSSALIFALFVVAVSCCFFFSFKEISLTLIIYSERGDLVTSWFKAYHVRIFSNLFHCSSCVRTRTRVTWKPSAMQLLLLLLCSLCFRWRFDELLSFEFRQQNNYGFLNVCWCCFAVESISIASLAESACQIYVSIKDWS